MIRSFADRATEDIFNGKSSPAARRALPRQLIRIALRKLEQIDSTERLDDLRIPPGKAWGESGPEEVEIVDYHRG
jgi:proteic killer suppression protein